ncbi:hypothetical protein ST47_g9101 [Ascochyta rabiei]|uniref:BTB domain-containing protein n=1 Tax=Didymella rabiei TaxID=5454 RepID=A0A162XL33_DIDRA|nr:hypothetical protein ST47_g9101 [Ascochyta rabiei]
MQPLQPRFARRIEAARLKQSYEHIYEYPGIEFQPGQLFHTEPTVMADPSTTVSFEEFIQSDLFTFYIGEHEKPFVVHSKAVAATYRYFDRLVNGGLSESQSRSAKFDDVDPETFTRFLEYAYRGDYTTPSCTGEPDTANENGTKSPKVNTKAPEKIDDISSDEDTVTTFAVWSNSNSAPSAYSAYGDVASPNKIKKPKREQRSSRVKFDKREYTHPGDGLFSIQRNTSAEQDFTPVFLAHAQLYTLADMRMVYPLKDLVLHRLHKTLVGFELYPERLGDVVELAKYAYEHGEDRAVDGRIDALRDMIVNYIACEMKVLGKHAEFRNLMDGGGEFAGDFWDIVSQELL